MFQYVRREGNRLAHCLAKKAVLSAYTDVWVESLPENVEDVFHSDLPQTCGVFLVLVFLTNILLTFVSKKKKKKKFSLVRCNLQPIVLGHGIKVGKY